MEIREQEVRAFFIKRHYEADEEQIRLNVRFCNIVSAFVHYKLSTSEILVTHDFLSDLILGKLPRFEIVTENKRISAQIRWMEKIPPTRGKLDMKEKEMFAFIIFWATCMFGLDENGKPVPGYLDIDSVESVQMLYESHKKANPEKFNFSFATSSSPVSKDFGLSLNNPILATSISSAYEYLGRLRRLDGRLLRKGRVMTMMKNGSFIDKYEIFVQGEKEPMYLYIDGYASEDSTIAPRGFKLV